MRATLVVLVALAGVAHADEPVEPRVTSTVLTLQRGAAKPARLLVQKTEVDHPRPLQPCPVKLVVTPQHGQFRRFELDFTYASGSRGNLPMMIQAKTAPTGAVVTAKGKASVKRVKQKLVVTLAARVDHAGAPWQLRGTVEVANAPCLHDIN